MLAENAAIIVFAVYMAGVLLLAVLSHRVQQGKSFLSEYFLGGRSLGMWSFALTFAATSASGGSFIGFPSLVYTHGWSLALWIGSYMLVPLVSMGLLAKRMNQIARCTDAITIPDWLRARFESGRLGVLATFLIAFFLTFNLVAQFKAGSVILQSLLAGLPWFEAIKSQFAETIASAPAVANWPWVDTLMTNPGYALCLIVFATTVVFYTTFGGFRAVVWTDVLQGFVMVGGVLLMLPIALIVAGGLGRVTQEMATMTPPRHVLLYLERSTPLDDGDTLPANSWLELQSGHNNRRVFRTEDLVRFAAGDNSGQAFDSATGDWQPSIRAIEITYQPHVDSASISDKAQQLTVEVATDELGQERIEPYAYGDGKPGVYVTPPGPHPHKVDGFLPISLAISFFFMWTFSGAGQPSNMVRLMAFHGSKTLRRALFTMSIYYSLIYFPLVVIFCTARVLLPGWETESDRIMPEMATLITAAIKVPWLAGVLVAAPFAAVMSTMDSFLLMISSALVRDIYQRLIHPTASERRIRWLTYAVTLAIGLGAMLAALNPPQFLQDIIVFTGAGLSSSFLVPVALAVYWPRYNEPGAMSAMLSGFVSLSCLYFVGWWQSGQVSAFEPFGFHPFLVSVVVSLVVSIGVTWMTAPPAEHLLEKFFWAPRQDSRREV